MEGEVCQFAKFGYCKFKESCKRTHLIQICENLSKCDDTKKCNKRHPKDCIKHASENKCRFGEDCAYSHKNMKPDGNINELKKKVDNLVKIVFDLTNKLVSMEVELKELTNVHICENTNDAAKKSENKDDQKTSEAREANSGSDNKIISEKEKDNTEPKNSTFSCDNCEYTCKNKKSLKKHGNTKHHKNICKMCSVKSKTAIELIQHKEKHHKSKEFIETITDHNKEETNTKFVFSESMLDEIQKLDAGDELDEFLKVN
jgi:hypothetical protein